MVRVVRIINLDDKHSENILFSWSKPSNYQEKVRCHDGQTDIRTDGIVKIELEFWTQNSQYL